MGAKACHDLWDPLHTLMKRLRNVYGFVPGSSREWEGVYYVVGVRQYVHHF